MPRIVAQDPDRENLVGSRCHGGQGGHDTEGSRGSRWGSGVTGITGARGHGRHGVMVTGGV